MSGRLVILAVFAVTGCDRASPPPPSPPPASPRPPAPLARVVDTRPIVDAGPVDAFHVGWSGAADAIAVAPRAADTIAHYCAGRATCGAPATGPALAWPAGWTAQYFHDGDSCSAALAIAGATYILDDLGPTCGDLAFDRCEGRAAITEAGPWVGIVTTHPRVNPFADTMPGSLADEEIRICSAAPGFACSDPIPIGKLKCDPYAAGISPGGDGLAIHWFASRLAAQLTATSVRFTWVAGPHDDALTAGTFALARSE